MKALQFLDRRSRQNNAEVPLWAKAGLIMSALLLCFAVSLECGFFAQKIKPRMMPEPTGKFGWSFVLSGVPSRRFFSTGPAWFYPPLQVDVAGQLLKKSGAGFDEILNLGDGRFNQFGERVFFSLPEGVTQKSLADVTVVRPIFFHPWIEVLIFLCFFLILRCTYIDQVRLVVSHYRQWCQSRKIQTCLFPLIVIGLLMFWQICTTLPVKCVFFNPDSGGYLAPDIVSFRRTFGYIIFLKALCQFTGELWLAGPIQWTAYATSAVLLSCLFEKHLKNGVLAFVLGAVLICKCSMIKWAYSILADCLFGASIVWFFIGIVSIVVEKSNWRLWLQVAIAFAGALALRPIGAFLAVMPIFAFLSAESRRRQFAVLLSIALLVPLVCEGVDKALAKFWHSPNPDFKSTGICTMGSFAWFLDKSVQTENPELRDLIVDRTADFRDKFYKASDSERIIMDQRDIFPITWERLPAALEQWKHTKEGQMAGIKSTDDICSVTVNKVFTRLAWQIATQRTDRVLNLVLHRAQDVMSSRLTGEWLVPLYSQLAGMESGVSDPAGIHWIKHYPFVYFETKDSFNVNLVLEKNRRVLNCFVFLMFLLTCASLLVSLCSTRAFYSDQKVVALAWLLSMSYFACVCVMQPVLDRYAEPMVPLVLFAAFGQLLLTLRSILSYKRRKTQYDGTVASSS